MSKQIYIYVGPHRSGSNFLNNQIFPKIPGVFSAFSQDPDIQYLLLNAMDGHSLFTDFDAVRRRIDARLEKIEEDIVLISDEEFFGDYGHYHADGLFLSPPFHDHAWRMEVLTRVFDSPKIILTFRRQDKWFESSYMHYIHNYFYLTMDEYWGPPKVQGGYFSEPYDFRSEQQSCAYKMLDWGVYLNNCFGKFGRDNVLVIPNELMAEDLHGALKRLYGFMGLENGYFPENIPHTNRSMSKTALKLALIFNRFVLLKQNRFGFIPETPFMHWILKKRREKDNRILWFLNGITRRIRLSWFLIDVISKFKYQRPDPLSPERREEILSYYRDRNKTYAEMIGMDLSKYGYY